MQLFLEGHNVKRGYAVSVQFSNHEIMAMPAIVGDEQIAPARFYQNRRYADRVISRFNRRFTNR